MVLITYVCICELAVEGLLGRELGLLEALPGVHVLVGVHTLAHEEVALRLMAGCYLESLGWVRCNQLVE